MALLRLGVSACLLGEMVRYDGGHQRNKYLTEVLGEDVEWRPLCPEVEIGLGTPRPSIRLEAGRDGTRLKEPSSGNDYTSKMQEWSDGAMGQLQDVDGFVLKKDSPSCGPDRVKLYDGDKVTRDGQGLFAASLVHNLPWLPVIDDGRLHDPVLRESFLDHAVWMRRWRDSGGLNQSASQLMDFHRRHKISYLSHSPAGAKELGQSAAAHSPQEYLEMAATTMAQPASRGRHANALQHMAGYISKGLDEADRAELSDTITNYANGLEPLLVPLTLVRHHARRHEVAWLLEQTYLDPYPREWQLRLGL